jgi:hypothetical protein
MLGIVYGKFFFWNEKDPHAAEHFSLRHGILYPSSVPKNALSVAHSLKEKMT